MKPPVPLILGAVWEHHYIRADQPDNRMCVIMNYLSSKLATFTNWFFYVRREPSCITVSVCMHNTSSTTKHTVQLCYSKWLIKGIQVLCFQLVILQLVTRPVNMGHVNLTPRLSLMYYTSIFMWVESHLGKECTAAHVSLKWQYFPLCPEIAVKSNLEVYNSLTWWGIVDCLALVSLCWAEKTAMKLIYLTLCE